MACFVKRSPLMPVFEDGVAGDAECGGGVGNVAAMLLQDLANV